jgi:hypothetical protein
MSQAFPPLGPEFEPFLFAVVCNEGNGMPLTLVSVIARSGADPWKEAARIAKLPRDAALEVLARMIPEGGADGAAIAARLFALLPVARQKLFIPVVASKTVAPRWSPVVPVIIALLLGLAIVSALMKTSHSDAGPHEAPAPITEKGDH